jgi:hypothetical protein
MNYLHIHKNKRILLSIFVLIVCLFSSGIITGCIGNYGRVKRNTFISRAFETDRVPSNYNYYYYGRTNMPYIIIGIDPSYNLHSKMWRKIEPGSKQFKKMTRWVWSGYDYYPRGADIVDDAGTKIGIWYSGVRWSAVKLEDDQGNLMIAPDTPWMLGTH